VPFSIEWTKDGAVKTFTGKVTFEEILGSEREISGNSNYRTLWYVVSDFMNAQHPGMNESECADVRVLRLGGFYSNPRIKFAFASEDSKLKRAIEKSVIEGYTLHPTKVFPTFDAAMAWAAVI
jgi:hypothetical protein